MSGSFSKKAPTPSKAPLGSKSRGSVKRNSSLLNFFQKTDGPPQATSRQSRITQFATKLDRSSKSGNTTPSLRREASSKSVNSAGGLFLEDKSGRGSLFGGTVATEELERARSRTPDDIWGERDIGESEVPEGEKYIENGSAVKRRKMDCSVDQKAHNDSDTVCTPLSTKDRHVSGPFIDESDSEDDLQPFGEFEEGTMDPRKEDTEGKEKLTDIDNNEDRANSKRPTTVVPPLVREAMSHIADDEYTNFDDLEEDGFSGEDEFLDQESELEENGVEEVICCGDSTALERGDTDFRDEVSTCPICQVELFGLNEAQDVSVHVNDCLDGKPSAIPPNIKPEVLQEDLRPLAQPSVAKPAQKDPYFLDKRKPKTGTAFSKLMAGNAEDTAWTTAAAREVASRGKPAHQRTCPFYKIIPGLSICVDAFRYGAVEGCTAYFLTHFHSDHYMGLTASWRHGPIYCSRPTANLVRQQLKVDPKWVVDLDFEKKTEVPGTNGVQVTLIEANHCPGSALFLFEKQIGSGSSRKVQRILHCGDFRASPTHVQHSLLRPETLDPNTGRSRQQWIDVCYLDTTYLNPKYSFPSQEDVIKACADLCVGLDQSSGDEFGQMVRQPQPVKTGQGNMMSRFISSVTGLSKPQGQGPGAAGRLLVVIGTYSIGKERICLGIARALKSKIYATAAKQRVCNCLEDGELSSLLTDNPLEAQVHMQTLFEIRAETLADYLDSMRPHFSRVVGFRPTGWTYRPPAGRTMDNPPVSTVLHSSHWRTPFTVQDLAAQRGSTRESSCYGVPYSEHSSFRELTMFCCALRIGRVIPTVNVGSRKTRESMKGWVERWEAEKRKSGLYRWEQPP
ncbi:hypothetical protein EYZ11_001985 [Aspergillus tanneri]|uniref:DNA repair metallo-beta-lactamase domain-containing protein n=1 Tax=Aspergillus tanneri TaxID=1220188 RepID=A0A4S3JSD5_9EURO|nr:uncharacterized protein ATNIH1004_004197 [Aspergillus tanneri]KAA8648312.1 hypothetical protein ATNIH1004_004197 [Aspergillus tanneri]THC98555.1 hypothetical protein EYZ11_001985 [Aspergillus tanneri]